MTGPDPLRDDPRVQRALDRLRAARAALSRGNRWGETRRFSGRAAGARLDRLDRAQAALTRAIDAAEKRRGKKL